MIGRWRTNVLRRIETSIIRFVGEWLRDYLRSMGRNEAGCSVVCAKSKPLCDTRGRNEVVAPLPAGSASCSCRRYEECQHRELHFLHLANGPNFTGYRVRDLVTAVTISAFCCSVGHAVHPGCMLQYYGSGSSHVPSATQLQILRSCSPLRDSEYARVRPNHCRYSENVLSTRERSRHG